MLVWIRAHHSIDSWDVLIREESVMMFAALALRHDQRAAIKVLIVIVQLFWLMSPVLGTHFRGGYISWSAVSPSITNTSTVAVAIHQIYSWANSVVPCGQLIGTAGFLRCYSTTCSNYANNVSVLVPCLSFDLGLDVSTGSGTASVTLLAGSQIVIGYRSTNWLTLVYGAVFPPWSVITYINLVVRSDNGRINSSPVSSIAPLVTVLVNSLQTFRIPIADADLDVVQCRWATNTTVIGPDIVDECGGVCQNMPGAQLYSTANLVNNCTLVFSVSISGYYAIALQIEDFMPSNISGPALSSIPLQFLVLAMNTSCNAPTIIGELSNGVTRQVPFGSTFTVSVIAQIGCNGTSVTRFTTMSIPPGTASTSTVVSINASLYSVIFTWTPSVTQVGTTQLYCTLAIASNNLQSAQYCLNFIVVNATTSTTIAESSISVSSGENISLVKSLHCIRQGLPYPLS